MRTFDHIIRQLSFDISINGQPSNELLHEEITEYCGNVFPLEIEKKLELNNLTTSHFIDRIELDLGHVTEANWKLDICDKLADKLTEELNNINQTLPRKKEKEQTFINASNLEHTNNLENASEINPKSESFASLIDDQTMHSLNFKALCFFLERGYFPWWYTKESIDFKMDDFFNISLSKTQNQSLIKLFLYKEETLKRFLTVISDDKIPSFINLGYVKVLTAAQIERIGIILKEERILTIKNEVLRFAYWETILKNRKETYHIAHLFSNLFNNTVHDKSKNDFKDKTRFDPFYKKIKQELIIDNVELAFVKRAFRQFFNSTENKSKNIIQSNIEELPIKSNEKNNHKIQSESIDFIKVSKEKTSSKFLLPEIDLAKEKSEGIYISFAGIILLHPLLPAFFSNLQLLENGQWKNKVAQIKAVHLLAKLAIGEAHYKEYQCILFKQLCGLDWETLIAPKPQFSKDELEEVDALLWSVISHWKAVKDTSIDGLRSGFINRDGKLWKDESGWQLRVDQKAQDILLQQLPWGINMIKFPWLNHLLRITWI